MLDFPMIIYLVLTTNPSRKYDHLHTADKDTEGHRTEGYPQDLSSDTTFPLGRQWEMKVSFKQKSCSPPLPFQGGGKKPHTTHTKRTLLWTHFYKLQVLII